MNVDCFDIISFSNLFLTHIVCLKFCRVADNVGSLSLVKWLDFLII